MKKIFLGVIIMSSISICTVAGIEASQQQKQQKLSALTLANIEAITDEETTVCPDYNYVPDHYIEATAEAINTTCSKKGELQVGSHIIHGSFDRGEQYVVVIETKNCDGQQKGACCDQREVGVSIVVD